MRPLLQRSGQCKAADREVARSRPSRVFSLYPRCVCMYVWLSIANSRRPRNRNEMKLTSILHASEELDNNLGWRSDHNLSSSTLFGVVDCLKTIGENWHTNHLLLIWWLVLRWKRRGARETREIIKCENYITIVSFNILIKYTKPKASVLW